MARRVLCSFTHEQARWLLIAVGVRREGLEDDGNAPRQVAALEGAERELRQAIADAGTYMFPWNVGKKK